MIYFDNSATTRVDREAAEKAVEIMTENFGNPSSLHYVGAQAYQALGIARNQIAKMIGAKTHCIYFTSGGTESNNIALQGGIAANRAPGKKIVTTAIEHDSILACGKALEKQGITVVYVAPDPQTHCIRAQDVIDAVDEETVLVSVMQVNNETGELLPLREIVKGVRAKNPQTLIHCDCVQGFGKIPFKLFEIDADLVSASSHKIHGPKGVGMLYIKDGRSIAPLEYGGSQEGKINPGTENVPLACAFGTAADLELARILENYEAVKKVKQHLCARLRETIPQVHFNTPENSSPYVLNFSVPGQESSGMVSYCSLHDIYLSAGSACTKGAKSHVLIAAGYADSIVSSALRVSFSKHSTIEETDTLVEVLQAYLTNLKKG